MKNRSEVINLSNVGDITLERSKLAKHIRMSIKPPSTIRVAVPVGVSFKEAQSFAISKEGWLKKQVQRFSRSKINSLHEKYSLKSKKELKIRSDAIIIRVKYLAEKHGFTFNKISTRLMKSRWGSCSYHNNISINICLSDLPQRLIDCVILHELMHTRIKNHSVYFWSELNNLVEDLKGLRKELKEDYFL